VLGIADLNPISSTPGTFLFRVLRQQSLTLLPFRFGAVGVGFGKCLLLSVPFECLLTFMLFEPFRYNFTPVRYSACGLSSIIVPKPFIFYRGLLNGSNTFCFPGLKYTFNIAPSRFILLQSAFHGIQNECFTHVLDPLADVVKNIRTGRVEVMLVKLNGGRC